MRKFIFTPDKHVGWERKNGKLVPLHNEKAINAMLKFASDFKPDVWIEGGDNLDCGPASHWLQNKKISIQELDLSKDVREYTKLVLNPINSIMDRKGTEKFWMEGNHEMWPKDIGEINPGLANLLEMRTLLDLKGWNYVEQGDYIKLGKLYFVHGDNIGNGGNLAAKALALYGHPVNFGHFHTHQVATAYSILDVKQTKTAKAIPGLCNRNPNYLRNRPNQWQLGFNYGYIQDNGMFNDYVPIILDGRFCAEGKLYVG